MKPWIALHWGLRRMPGPRPVLIIDDDAALAGTWPSSLRMEGEFATSVATTLAEASALFAAPGARFDLVLLDVRLPDGDGREFCVRLRRTGPHARHHADRLGQRIRCGQRPRRRGPTTHRQALPAERAARPHARANCAATTAARMRCSASARNLFRPSAKQFAGRGQGQADPLTREGGGDPEIPLPRRRRPVPRTCCSTTCGGTTATSPPYAGDAYLPAAAEDRAEPGRGAPAGDRGRRLSARGQAGTGRGVIDGPG